MFLYHACHGRAHALRRRWHIGKRSTIGARSTARAAALLPPVTPGDVLGKEFMEPLGLPARALARDLGVPPNRIMATLNGERAITADTALRLARRFDTSPEFWMNLQTAHDLEVARTELAELATVA